MNQHTPLKQPRCQCVRTDCHRYGAPCSYVIRVASGLLICRGCYESGHGQRLEKHITSATQPHNVTCGCGREV